MDLIRTKVNLDTVDERVKILNQKIDELVNDYLVLRKNKDDIINADFKLFRGEIEALMFKTIKDEYLKMKSQIESDMNNIIELKLKSIEHKNEETILSFKKSLNDNINDTMTKFVGKVQNRIKQQNEDISFIKNFFIEDKTQLIITTDKIIKTLNVCVNKYSFNDLVIVCVESFKINNINSVKHFEIKFKTEIEKEGKSIITINNKEYNINYVIKDNKIEITIDDFVIKDDNYFVKEFIISYKK